MRKRDPERAKMLPLDEYMHRAFDAWLQVDQKNIVELVQLAARVPPGVREAIRTALLAKIARENDSPGGFNAFYSVIMGDTRIVGSR